MFGHLEARIIEGGVTKRILVTLGLLLVLWSGCRLTPATFAIKNESGQTLHSLTVEVGGKTYHYSDIPPEGEVAGWFHVWQDEVFDVSGEYEDGTMFTDFCGYVVWEEFAPHTRIVVLPEGRVNTR
jgi:hypothetical protein